MTDDEELARRVRAARAYAGITQEEIAEQLAVSTVTYKRIEAGKRALTLDEVRRVSEITTLPIDFFTGEVQELGASRESKQQLEELRTEISGLVERLADIEWRMRKTIEDERKS